jgi:repressor LexA
MRRNQICEHRNQISYYPTSFPTIHTNFAFCSLIFDSLVVGSLNFNICICGPRPISEPNQLLPTFGFYYTLAIRFLFAYISSMAITRRQKEVIDFLSSFTQKNGYSPSYEEIASGLGLSSLATVHKHVTNLQNKGLLQRAHNRSRSIDVLPARSSKKGSDRLPLLGRIAAGQPVEAIETAESISLSDIIGNREVFALEVRGDSMRDEHIVSGDYVLVERTRTAREGEIIVALIDGADATLKRFYREGSMIRLQPSNAEMSPIYAPAANVIIQGKVLGVLRKYA